MTTQNAKDTYGGQELTECPKTNSERPNHWQRTFTEDCSDIIPDYQWGQKASGDAVQITSAMEHSVYSIDGIDVLVLLVLLVYLVLLVILVILVRTRLIFKFDAAGRT